MSPSIYPHLPSISTEARPSLKQKTSSYIAGITVLKPSLKPHLPPFIILRQLSIVRGSVSFSGFCGRCCFTDCEVCLCLLSARLSASPNLEVCSCLSPLTVFVSPFCSRFCLFGFSADCSVLLFPDFSASTLNAIPDARSESFTSKSIFLLKPCILYISLSVRFIKSPAVEILFLSNSSQVASQIPISSVVFDNCSAEYITSATASV